MSDSTSSDAPPRETLRLRTEAHDIAVAAALLRRGGLVVFPTETVYGLGADARSPAAVTGIYAAKARPRFNPLIAHVASLEDARREGLLGADALALAHAFWPGPLTLVVPRTRSGSVCDLARAGLDSVALRVPGHPVARALLSLAGVPVAAPSANRSGRVSPTTAAHAAEELDGRVDAVLDGGPTDVGVESTIVACLGTPVLLRPGGITRDALEATLAARLGEAVPGGPTIAPGLLVSHYAPHARVRLEVDRVEPGDAVLDFAGRLRGADTERYLDLSPRGDLAEAAANLFAHLRRLDRGGAIAVAPVPRQGLGEAINDRLARAAAPR